MISVLIDTDVLIDVALGRKDFVESSSIILDLAETNQIKAFIAWHSISNFYYLVEANFKKATPLEFIRELLGFVKIAPTTTKEAIYALDLGLRDFEDAPQIAAAKVCNAEYIITRNIKHYKKSPIPALSPKQFIVKFKEDKL